MQVNKIYTFFAQYPEIKYARGEKILRPNEYANHVYFTASGYVKLYKLFKSGQEVSISIYNPKKLKHPIFGHTDLLCDYFVEAFTDVVIYRAPKSDFNKFLSENNDIKEFMFKEFHMVLEELINQIEWLSIPDAYTRIKKVLYSLGKRIGVEEKGKLFLDNDNQFEIKVTHQLIASMAGLSRETVTIQINKLIANGFLARINNKLAIMNLEELIKDI